MNMIKHIYYTDTNTGYVWSLSYGGLAGHKKELRKWFNENEIKCNISEIQMLYFIEGGHSMRLKFHNKKSFVASKLRFG